ncbi:MerR family transcriptional regulator, partial [Staphylococcus arlettae]
MTQYLTGELAKLCSISTRTLQYYDKKDLLKPAYIKDNNYRIYTDNEVERLKTILTLK